MTGLIDFLCGIGVLWYLTKLNSKYKINFIDDEILKNEIESDSDE